VGMFGIEPQGPVLGRRTAIERLGRLRDFGEGLGISAFLIGRRGILGISQIRFLLLLGLMT
jgi:hypothetical protein